MENKVAVLGGTFNPIHIGHLKMAESVIDELGYSKVIFLPNGNPPHKRTRCVIDASFRYDMVRLATDENPFFEVSDYEIKKQSPSYTIETLPYMKSVYGNDISWIIGADSLYSLRKWRSYERLIKECSFIVADRSLGTCENIFEIGDSLAREGAKITYLSMAAVDVTSTGIRELVMNGKDFKNLVPEKVYDYIIAHRLYQSCSED